MALSTDYEGKYIAANDSAGLLLTSTARQDILLSMGFAFEAVAAQAAFVEAIVLFYLSTARSRLPNDQLITFEKRLRNNSLTFGAMVKLILDNKLLPTSMSKNLSSYVEARNTIIHSAIASSASVNLEENYCLGAAIISELKSHQTGYLAAIFIPHSKK